jgi:hypothetical protein
VDWIDAMVVKMGLLRVRWRACSWVVVFSLVVDNEGEVRKLEEGLGFLVIAGKEGWRWKLRHLGTMIH